MEGGRKNSAAAGLRSSGGLPVLSPSPVATPSGTASPVAQGGRKGAFGVSGSSVSRTTPEKSP